MRSIFYSNKACFSHFKVQAVLSAVLILFSFQAFAQSAPTENSFLLDAYSYISSKERGKIKIKLTNDQCDSTGIFTVYNFDEDQNGWAECKKITFKNAKDSQSVDVPKTQYYAIVPQYNGVYEYKVKKSTDSASKITTFTVTISQISAPSSTVAQKVAVPEPASKGSVSALPEESAFLINAYSVRGSKTGRINLVNQNVDTNNAFTIYYFDNAKSSWKKYGNSVFNKVGDSFFLQGPSVQYYAIAAKNNKDIEYKIRKDSPNSSLTDLVIYVLKKADLPAPPSESSFVFDSWAVIGIAQDNIRLINSSFDDSMSFFVMYFDDAAAKWKLFGLSGLKTFNDTAFVSVPPETKIKDITKIRFFAIAPKNKKPYQYEITKEHNDIYIYVKNPEGTADINDLESLLK